MERFCLPAQISRYTSFIYGCWLHPNAPSLQQQDKKKKLEKNIDYGKLTEKPALNAKEQEFYSQRKKDLSHWQWSRKSPFERFWLHCYLLRGVEEAFAQCPDHTKVWDRQYFTSGDFKATSWWGTLFLNDSTLYFSTRRKTSLSKFSRK